jgi:hypothetical protein
MPALASADTLLRTRHRPRCALAASGHTAAAPSINDPFFGTLFV